MQYIINGIIAGASCALVAVGFGLILHVRRFFHFAHGGVYTLGAYTAYALVRILGWRVWIAVPSAILVAGLAGAAMYFVAYRPLQRVRATSLTLLMASLGLLLVMQNALSLVFGDDPKSLRTGIVNEGYLFLGARITAIQIVTILAVIVVFGALGYFLKFTNIGKELRAVANDQDLAEVIGLGVGTVVFLTFVLGSTLAGLAAVLAAYDTALSPLMGFRALLGAVVAVIIGGKGSILGVLLGGLLVGLVQNLVVWKLPTHWQDAIVFCVLIAFLLLRPRGILGKPLHKAAI